MEVIYAKWVKIVLYEKLKTLKKILLYGLLLQTCARDCKSCYCILAFQHTSSVNQSLCVGTEQKFHDFFSCIPLMMIACLIAMIH